jgi:two-component system, NarL family, invasion response regulator UvrY
MTAQKQPIKIAIVDDHNLFRKGLIKLIDLGDKDKKYSILFEAGDGNELVEKLNKKSLPDIILMDIDMPNMDGYETVAWLQKFHPAISILVISMFESKKDIIRMLKMKVKGYLSKDIKVEDMHKALDGIVEKGFYYTDEVATIMATTLQEGDTDHLVFQSDGNDIPIELSENERVFIKLACTELTYAQIAEKMNLSAKTIEGYREGLFQRFSFKNRVSLAMFAVRNGIVKL